MFCEDNFEDGKHLKMSDYSYYLTLNTAFTKGFAEVKAFIAFMMSISLLVKPLL